MAAGDADACMAMAIGWSPKANFGMNQLVTDNTRDKAALIEPVRMARVDDVIPPNKQVQFLKMDIEGAECNALRGLRDLFAARRVERLFVEVHPITLNALGCSVRTMGKLLGTLCMNVSHFEWDSTDGKDFLTVPADGDCQVPARDQLP